MKKKNLTWIFLLLIGLGLTAAARERISPRERRSLS